VRHSRRTERFRPIVTATWIPLLALTLDHRPFVIDRALSRIHFVHALRIYGGLFGFTEPHGQFLAIAESAARNLRVTSALREPDFTNEYPAIEVMEAGNADIDDPWQNSLTACQAFILRNSFLTELSYPVSPYTRYSRLRKAYREK
jgi:hypothetical protein